MHKFELCINEIELLCESVCVCLGDVQSVHKNKYRFQLTDFSKNTSFTSYGSCFCDIAAIFKQCSAESVGWA